MTKLKIIKRKFKQTKNWKKYKKLYKHKQMKFLFSKIALTYNSTVNIDSLIKIEEKIANLSNIKKTMFVDVYSNMSSLTSVQANWEEFAKFIFYVYETSKVYKWKNKNNIFYKETFIVANENKREHFYKWLHSMNKTKDDFNEKIMKIQKLVF